MGLKKILKCITSLKNVVAISALIFSSCLSDLRVCDEFSCTSKSDLIDLESGSRSPKLLMYHLIGDFPDEIFKVSSLLEYDGIKFSCSYILITARKVESHIIESKAISLQSILIDDSIYYYSKTFENGGECLLKNKDKYILLRYING